MLPPIKKRKRMINIVFRLDPEYDLRLEMAVEKMRKETGEKITKSDIIRELIANLLK